MSYNVKHFSARRLSHNALTAFLILCAASCSTPLAPSYRILKETREVQFVSGQTSELHIRATYMLENYGNSALASMDLLLPDAKPSGMKNLRVEENGHDIAVTGTEHEASNTLRVPFNPPWTRGQRRNLNIEYTFSSPEDQGERITLGATSFHLGSRGWFPVLQPPSHVLSSYPESPKRIVYSVRVPANFLILAGGTPAGRKQSAREVEYRFELRKDDFAPYVVAGNYVDSSSVNRTPANAVFWTLEPLKDDPTLAETRITTVWNTLQNAFGPLEKNGRAPHIVESSELRSGMDGEDAAAVPFPGGALVNREALAMGIGSDNFLEAVTRALAQNWFGEQVYASPNAAIGIGEGLPGYAVIVSGEARAGEGARRQQVTQLIREYDDAQKLAAEKPLATSTSSDPIEQRRISMTKAPLFFIALEDAYGEAPVRHALTNVVTLLRGQEVGYDDLRSALEQATGSNLAPIFRTWLYGKGIPSEFREKYRLAGAEKN